MPSAENEPELFDVELEDAATTARKDREERKKRSASGSGSKGEPNTKRQKKNEKFGYGGKKRFTKSGDAMSSADMRDFPGKKMKKPFKGGGGAKARPGKARRAKARL
jgi:rRNA-processing protein EBP2